MARRIFDYFLLIISLVALILAIYGLSKSAAPSLPGEKGLQGPAGISGYQIVEHSVDNILGSGGLISQGVSADCPAGKKVLSGACEIGNHNFKSKSSSVTQPFVFESKPFENSSWQCSLDVSSLDLDYSFSNIIGVKAYAICANVD